MIICRRPRISDFIEHDILACLHCCAWGYIPYHCKPFCWCFLLLILSLGSCYIKLLSGLPVLVVVVVGVKKSCLKCLCAHVHCPQYKDKWLCVGQGWEETEWRRGAQIQKRKYLQRDKEAEKRKRQAVQRKECFVMFSRERRITWERIRAQGKHNK